MPPAWSLYSRVLVGVGFRLANEHKSLALDPKSRGNPPEPQHR